MTSAAERLWHVNNEYRRLISQIGKYLDLLEQLMLTRDDHDSLYVLEAVRQAQQKVAALADDHRHWRYRYYYEAAQSKRMVQSETGVKKALIYFSVMSARHGQVLNELYSIIGKTPRPAPHLTHVPTGDLWVMLEYAVGEITTFVHNLSLAD